LCGVVPKGTKAVAAVCGNFLVVVGDHHNIGTGERRSKGSRKNERTGVSEISRHISIKGIVEIKFAAWDRAVVETLVEERGCAEGCLKGI